MNTSTRLFVILVQVVLLVAPAMVFAEPVPYKQPDIVWTKNANSHTGRYVTSSSAVAQAFTLSVDGLYYYGDMDNYDVPFKGGFNVGNIGFMANLSYVQPLGESGVNMRYTLGGGMLRGDGMNGSVDSLKRDRNFSSAMGRAAVGVEWYPFTTAGFYVYGGFSVAYNHTKYHVATVTDTYNGSSDNIALMVPIEIGYNWKLNKSWLLGVHAGWATCILDKKGMNLDGWPGEDFGYSSQNKAVDGWFQLGITIGYSWHNCETCRLRKW